MAVIFTDTRRIEKIITGTDVKPTVPASNDHTDGSWVNTDIYEGEMCLNTTDGLWYTRSGSTIFNVTGYPYPEMDEAARDLLVVVEGFKIKNTDTGMYQMYNGVAWMNIHVPSTSDLLRIISITHAALLVLISGNSLVPGQPYEINDYATKYNQAVTDTLKTTTVEPITVTALSDNKLGKEAKSKAYPHDIIHYDVADILCEDAATSRKGKITYRIDSDGNSTHYDSRGVYHDRAGDVLTFGAGCSGNKVGKNEGAGFHYNDIVFGDNCIGNTVKESGKTMTFGAGLEGVEFGVNCSAIELSGTATKYNKFGGNVTNLTSAINFNNVEVCSNLDFTAHDFSAATFVATSYKKTIFSDSADNIKLSYIDSSNAIQYALPTA